MSLKENDIFLEWLFQKELETTKDPDKALAKAERKFDQYEL